MSDFVFTVAKGKTLYYAGLPGANDAIMALPLELAGLEADAALRDHNTVAALLAGSSNEQADGRLTLSITTGRDDTANEVSIDATDLLWEDADGNEMGAIVFYYNPDTTAGANDASCIPLSKFDFVMTPNGGDITAQVPAGGWLTA